MWHLKVYKKWNYLTSGIRMRPTSVSVNSERSKPFDCSWPDGGFVRRRSASDERHRRHPFSPKAAPRMPFSPFPFGGWCGTLTLSFLYPNVVFSVCVYKDVFCIHTTVTFGRIMTGFLNNNRWSRSTFLNWCSKRCVLRPDNFFCKYLIFGS